MVHGQDPCLIFCGVPNGFKLKKLVSDYGLVYNQYVDWAGYDLDVRREVQDKRRRESMARKRTTHRSKSGKKLYAVRDSKGRFVDIQTYERAHRMDMKRKSKKEK